MADQTLTIGIKLRLFPRSFAPRFDPTRLVPQSGLIRVGTGRDAADVSFATIFGPVQMNQMRLFMDYLPDAKPISENILIPTTEAIAIS